MITWIEQFVGPTKVWKAVLNVGTLDKDSVESSFREVWPDAAIKIAPMYAGVPWNTIRAELLEESGRVRIYPYKFNSKELALAGCEVSIPELSEFIRINDLEPTTESEEHLEKTINEVAAGIMGAADLNLCRIFARGSIRIDVCFSGDDEPIATRTMHERNLNSTGQP